LGQISLGGAKKGEFSKISALNAEFLEVSRQTWLVAEVPNRYFGSRVTTRAELNEIAQYLSAAIEGVSTSRERDRFRQGCVHMILDEVSFSPSFGAQLGAHMRVNQEHPGFCKG
jgi:hypothetical protein